MNSQKCDSHFIFSMVSHVDTPDFCGLRGSIRLQNCHICGSQFTYSFCECAVLLAFHSEEACSILSSHCGCVVSVPPSLLSDRN